MTAWSAPRRVCLTLLAAMTLAIAAAGTSAAATASLEVAPGTVVAGGSVHVTGTCEASSEGFAISSAFLHDATHDFAGVGATSFSSDAAGKFAADAQVPASTAPGSYTVTGRCGGGNLGVSATLVVTAAGSAPTSVPAGSGGRAAATTADSQHRDLALGGGGLLLAAGGVAGVIWYRRPVRR